MQKSSKWGGAVLAVLASLSNSVFFSSKAIAEDVVGLTALNSMERCQPEQKPFGETTAVISSARNEVESFQVVVAAQGRNLSVQAVTLPELVDKNGGKIDGANIRLYREEYVRVRKSTMRAELPPGLYPDALVPFVNPITGKPIEPFTKYYDRATQRRIGVGHDMYALPFDVHRGQTQTIWIDVHVPKNTAAGVYNGTVSVQTSEGNATLPVELTVWDFALPDGPTHSNHFGGFSRIVTFFNTVKAGTERFREIERRYCAALAEHRINPPLPGYMLPKTGPDGSLTVDPQHHQALSSFITEFHVTDFEIPRAPYRGFERPAEGGALTLDKASYEKSLRYYGDYYRYVKTNGWSDRAYVYLLDEPNSVEQYEQVIALAKVVREAAPDLKVLVVEQTYPHEPTWPDIDPAVDIWCALFGFIDRDTIQRKLAQGDAVWSYTALVQRAPTYHPKYAEVREKDPPYWHIDRPLLVYRVPTWINRQYGITGLLYWTTIQPVIEPWHNPAFAHPQHFNGGGYLLYPGAPCGMDGPVASMRLKNIRDSMEDYEYFVLMEKRCGKEAVRRLVDRVAPNWWEYTRDPRRILEARREMAEAILGI